MKDAWNELSQHAFGFYIRIHTFTAMQLKNGRESMSRTLKISESTLSRWMRELVSKGFIKVVPLAKGKRTGLVLLKRVRVRFGGRNNWFVRI